MRFIVLLKPVKFYTFILMINIQILVLLCSFDKISKKIYQTTVEVEEVEYNKIGISKGNRSLFNKIFHPILILKIRGWETMIKRKRFDPHNEPARSVY